MVIVGADFKIVIFIFLIELTSQVIKVITTSEEQLRRTMAIEALTLQLN